MKRTINRSGRVLSLVAIMLLTGSVLISGCSQTLGYKKLPVTFRRAALRPGLDRMTLLVGPFMQRSPRFQAAVDVKHMIQRKCEKNRIFNGVILSQDIIEIEDSDMTTEQALDSLRDRDWLTEYKDSEADFMVTGAVIFTSSDRSGYEADWVTNRYGYTYPRRVYVDRLGYTFAMGLMLVDLNSGEVVMEKTYEDDGYAEGTTDEISIFFEMAGSKIDECMESIQGPKVRTKRFLLYN